MSNPVPANLFSLNKSNGYYLDDPIWDMRKFDYNTCSSSCNKKTQYLPNRVNGHIVIKSGDFWIKEVSGLQMRDLNISKFVDTVYKNFIYLTNYPELKHTKKEINRLLTNLNTTAFFLYNGHKMIGYVINEVMRLNDGRLVLYIAYIYVAAKYRRHGFGSMLMKQTLEKARNLHVDAVLLTCDVVNEPVLDFYMQKGFMYDPYLRRYERYDVLSLYITK